MKFFSIIPIISFVSYVSAEAAILPTDFLFNLKEREVGGDIFEDLLSIADDFFLSKRDMASTIESVLTTVNLSGVVWTLVDEIAASNSSMNKIADLVISLLGDNSTSSTTSASAMGFNITLNTTELLDTVLESGLIDSTASGLLLNNATNDKLAGVVGHVLRATPWIAKLLQAGGEGEALSVDYIADTIKTFKSQDPNFAENSQKTSKQVVFKVSKRNANGTEGSALSFFGNVVNSVLGSNLVVSSVSDVVEALNSTGFVLDLVKQALDHTDELYTILSTIVPKLYDAGALDGLDIPKLMDESKKTHALANGIQFVFTSPKWAPGIARLFKTMDDAGVFYQVKLNLHGP